MEWAQAALLPDGSAPRAASDQLGATKDSFGLAAHVPTSGADPQDSVLALVQGSDAMSKTGDPPVPETPLHRLERDPSARDV